MKRLLKGMIVVAAMVPMGAVAQGIRHSRHDLSSSSAAGTKSAGGTPTNQICIFCHTPHRAQSTQLLWNHTASAVTVFNWGNDLDGNPLTNTTAGTTLPTSLKGRSQRCLGCHDGTIALGSVSNAGGGVAGTFTMTGDVDGTGKLNNAAYIIGGATGNLGGNHPVSIPYAGVSGYNTLNSKAITGSLGNYYATTTAGCTSASGVCTVEATNGAAINLIRDTSGSTNYGIECVSCHEPHNKTGFAYFTLVDNAATSNLCRACHWK